MRAVMLRAGLLLAPLAVAQPAMAQVTFLKCKGTFTDPSSGKRRHEKVFWAVEDGKLYFWQRVVGRVVTCGYAIGPEDRCTVTVTDAVIVKDEASGNYWSRLSIDRKTGAYSDAGNRGASSGFCRPIPDPRPAPRGI